MTRSQVAAFLREFADELDGLGRASATESSRGQDEWVPPDGDFVEGDATTDGAGTTGGTARDETDDYSGAHRQITIIVDGESATITVPDDVDFDIGIDSRSPLLSSADTQELTFELSWQVDTTDAGDGTIELV